MVPQNGKFLRLAVRLTGMGTASTMRVACPVEARLVEVIAAIDEVIGNDGGEPPADADVTVTFGKSGSAVTGLTMTFPTQGSTVGQVKKDEPTSETIVKQGEYLSATSGGGGAVTGAARFVFVLEQV